MTVVLPPAETVVFDKDTMDVLGSLRASWKFITTGKAGRKVDYYVVTLNGVNYFYQLVGPRFREGKVQYVGIRIS